MRKIELTVRTIDEIKEQSPKLYQKILDKNRYLNVDYDDWADFIEEDMNDDAMKQGFEVDKWLWSGFSSQGDGAMFEGTCDIAKYLEVNKQNFKHYEHIKKLLDNGEISYTIKFAHRGHYYHSKSYHATGIDMYFDYTDLDTEVLDELDLDIRQAYESLCEEMYDRLYKAYYELISDQEVYDALLANEYEFYNDGSIV